jgi:hypothetical protein
MLGNIFYPNERKKRREKVLPRNELPPKNAKEKALLIIYIYIF